MTQGRTMTQIPFALVETWLLIAANKSEENAIASQDATTNLINFFGSLDAAQRNLDENSKYLTQLEAEEA
jgi:hypothetical protein